MEQIDAKKTKIDKSDALRLVGDVDEIVASKGKRVVKINLEKEQPNAEFLASLLLGPTGNLRAPTLRVGKTLLVGFDEAAYRSVLK